MINLLIIIWGPLMSVSHTHNIASQLFLFLAFTFNENHKLPCRYMIKFRVSLIINSGEVLHMIMNEWIFHLFEVIWREMISRDFIQFLSLVFSVQLWTSLHLYTLKRQQLRGLLGFNIYWRNVPSWSCTPTN